MINKLSLFLLLIICASCAGNNDKSVHKAGSVKYARNFRLEQKKDYVKLTILSPNGHQVESEFALVKRDTKVSIPSELTRIDVPVQNIAAYSTTFVGMLSTLDETESIKATTSEQYIYNKKLKKLIKQGKVLTSDYDGSETPGALLKHEVSVVVYSGFGQPFPNADKLKQLEITCIANYDWEETHPLGKAEWIKLFGALYDKSEEADKYFDKISSDYFKLRKQIAKSKKHETVLVGGMVGDIWYASAGKSYLAGIMKDAGLNYVYSKTDGTASIPLTLSQVMRDEQQCTRWINAEAKNKEELLRLNPKFGYFNTVKSGQVYSYFNNQNYFWEYCSLHPEWLLEDFAIIGGTLPKKKMHFYQQLK